MRKTTRFMRCISCCLLILASVIVKGESADNIVASELPSSGYAVAGIYDGMSLSEAEEVIPSINTSGCIGTHIDYICTGDLREGESWLELNLEQDVVWGVSLTKPLNGVLLDDIIALAREEYSFIPEFDGNLTHKCTSQSIDSSDVQMASKEQIEHPDGAISRPLNCWNETSSGTVYFTRKTPDYTFNIYFGHDDEDSSVIDRLDVHIKNHRIAEYVMEKGRAAKRQRARDEKPESLF